MNLTMAMLLFTHQVKTLFTNQWLNLKTMLATKVNGQVMEPQEKVKVSKFGQMDQRMKVGGMKIRQLAKAD